MTSTTPDRFSSSSDSRVPAAAGSCAWLAVLALWGALGGCDGGTGPSEPLPDSLAVEVVASGLSSPLYLTAPRGDARLFVVEQPGRIRIIENGTLRPTPFLDITDRVLDGGERGLLSAAFHPSYATNGYFYVYYTGANGDIIIERYRVGSDPNVADRASAKPILTATHPRSNHNGGLALFGSDGMLYLGTGDGGGGGDPDRNGQNRGTLLGKLLRIDVDRGDPYAIPQDNPFVNQTGARGEVWAWGLRNPWRFAFDREEGTLYIADVGQNAWEEVNAGPAMAAGLNYGWVTMEGPVCYGAATCDQTGLTLPVVSYGRSDGCSVIGGFPYRGQRIPGAVGHYFYSDLCGGWLRSFRLVAGQPQEQREWSVGDLGSVLSFGEDGAGELYILSANGQVYRLIPGV